MTQQILVGGDRLAQPAGTVVTNGVLKTDAVGLISCAHGPCGRSRVCRRAAPPAERLACFGAEAASSRRPPVRVVLCSLPMPLSADPEGLVTQARQKWVDNQRSAAE